MPVAPNTMKRKRDHTPSNNPAKRVYVFLFIFYCLIRIYLFIYYLFIFFVLVLWDRLLPAPIENYSRWHREQLFITPTHKTLAVTAVALPRHLPPLRLRVPTLSCLGRQTL